MKSQASRRMLSLAANPRVFEALKLITDKRVPPTVAARHVILACDVAEYVDGTKPTEWVGMSQAGEFLEEALRLSRCDAGALSRIAAAVGAGQERCSTEEVDAGQEMYSTEVDAILTDTDTLTVEPFVLPDTITFSTDERRQS